jgi:hypothetical protein
MKVIIVDLFSTISSYSQIEIEYEESSFQSAEEQSYNLNNKFIRKLGKSSRKH